MELLLLLMVLLLTLLGMLLLLLPLVLATPCFSSVSMENPNDWDLLRLKGEARGP